MDNLGGIEIVVLMGLLILAGYMVLRFLVAFRNGMRRESVPAFQSMNGQVEKPKRDYFTLINGSELDKADNNAWDESDKPSHEEHN